MGTVTVTFALAFFVGSATLVAITVTVVLLVAFGAVNRPALETVPPLADQVTAVLVVPSTVAKNCCVCPDWSVALVGVTDTLTLEPEALAM